MHKIFWLENPKGRDQLEDLGVDGKITLEWTRCISLRIGTSGGSF
jgi:hypothetical protein